MVKKFFQVLIFSLCVFLGIQGFVNTAYSSVLLQNATINGNESTITQQTLIPGIYQLTGSWNPGSKESSCDGSCSINYGSTNNVADSVFYSSENEEAKYTKQLIIDTKSIYTFSFSTNKVYSDSFSWSMDINRISNVSFSELENPKISIVPNHKYQQFSGVCMLTKNNYPEVGQVASVDFSSDYPGAAVYYRWYRSNKSIKGATDPAYAVKKADLGKKLKLKITIKAQGYNTETITVNTNGKVIKKRPHSCF